MKVNAFLTKKTAHEKSENYISTPTVFSIIAILTGFVSGALLFCFFKGRLTDDILRLFISFFYDTSGKTNTEILSTMILSVLPYIIIMLILAFDLFGTHLCLIFTFFKSLAPTLLFSFLYNEYGLKGAEYVFLVLAAGEIISVFGILLTCSCCYIMSKIIRNVYFGNKTEFPPEIRNFLLKFTVGISIIIISRFITFLTVTTFRNLFVF